MKRLNKTIQVDPTFTHVDWQLYDSKPGVAEAALTLNAQLKFCINEAKYDRATAERHMYNIMSMHAQYGAIDSEPCWFLGDVLNQIFGDTDDWK